MLNEHVAKGGRYLSESVANRLLNLYLAGRSLDEIVRLNPQYKLPEMLYTRVVWRWDEKRRDHISILIHSLPERLGEIQARSIHHLLDKLTIADMEFKRQAEIYMQDPRPENLPKDAIQNSKEYKEVVETINSILKIGKMDAAATSGPAVTVNVTGEGASVSIPVPEEARDESHSKILDALLSYKESGNGG